MKGQIIPDLTTVQKKIIIIIMIRKFLNFGAKPQINIWKAKGYNIRKIRQKQKFVGNSYTVYSWKVLFCKEKCKNNRN